MKIFSTSSCARDLTLLVVFSLPFSGCTGFNSPSETLESLQIQGSNNSPEALQLAQDRTESNQASQTNPASQSSQDAPLAAAFQWPSFRGGPQNQGVSPVRVRSLSNLAQLREVNEFNTGGLVWATPVVDENGFIYVGAANKYFYSFTSDGQKRWEYQIDAKADSLIDSAAALVPALGQNPPLVVVPGGDGSLYALSRTTGALIWKFAAHGASESTHQSGVVVNSFEGNVQYSPAHQLIFAGSDNGAMYAVDSTGKERWSRQTGMMVWTAAAISPDQKWVTFGSLDGYLYLVDPMTGEDLAQPYHAKADIKSSPTIDEDGNIYFGSSNGEMTSLKVTPHIGAKKLALKLNWTFKTGREVYSSPAVAKGKLLFGSVDGVFYALNTKDGSIAWQFNAYSKILSSPLVTRDQVVLFGAKNGKLYALNLHKGDRIWSYRATLDPIKSNLDSSPSLDANGVIHVGSYNGRIYHIPYEYCFRHRGDRERCEFGGTKDQVDFDYPKNQPNQATLVFIPSQANKSLDSSSPLQLRLVVTENSDFIDSAAIDSLADSLTVEITPQVDIKTQVSSDGKYLNITPQTFFAPNTSYRIKVSGLYYKKSHNFVWDRINPINWVGKSFSAEQTFRTKPAQSDPWAELGASDSVTWGLKSMYLLQPEALDTYTPAALDGQGYLATAFAFNPRDQKMLMLALPALPQQDGKEDRFLLMPEPSKAFVLNGQFSKDNLKGQGGFKLAAMGGEMTLDPFTFSAALQPDTGNLDGQIQASSHCLNIKGNGSSYKFPFSLANEVCDAYGYLHALGLFKGIQIKTKPNLAKAVRFSTTGKTEAEIELQLPALNGPHLLSVVQYDSKSTTLVNHSVEMVPALVGGEKETWTKKLSLKANCESCCKTTSRHPVAVFFDAQKIDFSHLRECSEDSRTSGKAQQRQNQDL